MWVSDCRGERCRRLSRYSLSERETCERETFQGGLKDEREKDALERNQHHLKTPKKEQEELEYL